MADGELMQGKGGSRELAQAERILTRAEFHTLAQIPPESEWLANIRNPNTRRAYRKDVQEFCTFLGMEISGEFGHVTRAHVIAWRSKLETVVFPQPRSGENCRLDRVFGTISAI